jgi:hypothetical protein
MVTLACRQVCFRVMGTRRGGGLDVNDDMRSDDWIKWCCRSRCYLMTIMKDRGQDIRGMNNILCPDVCGWIQLYKQKKSRRSYVYFYPFASCILWYHLYLSISCSSQSRNAKSRIRKPAFSLIFISLKPMTIESNEHSLCQMTLTRTRTPPSESVGNIRSITKCTTSSTQIISVETRVTAIVNAGSAVVLRDI